VTVVGSHMSMVQYLAVKRSFTVKEVALSEKCVCVVQTMTAFAQHVPIYMM
jgi:hypothetical protein